MKIELGFSIICLFAASFAQAEDPLQIDRPTLQIGTRWTMQTIDGFTKLKQSERTSIISSIDEKTIRISDESGKVTTVLVAPTLAISQSGSRQFDPPIERTQFPLTIGKSWIQAYSYNNAQCGKTYSKLKFDVLQWEDIAIPAGKLRALLIESEGSWISSCGNDRQHHKYWYVPNVGIAKQESMTWAQGRLYSWEIQELVSGQAM